MKWKTPEIKSIVLLTCGHCFGQGGSPSSGIQAKVRPNEIANSQQAANSQFSLLAQIQAKEADIQALSALACSLEKKVIPLDGYFCINV
jgi:hypothetical protein